MNPACLLPGRTEPAKTRTGGAQLDAAHHTEQRGTQQSPAVLPGLKQPDGAVMLDGSSGWRAEFDDPSSLPISNSLR